MVSERDIKPWLRPSPSDYIFYNANVVDVATGTTIPNTTVRVTNGKISSLSPASESDKQQPSTPPTTTTKLIDCTNKYLSPGLIDCHVHLIAVPGFPSLSSAFGNPNDVSLLRQPYVAAQMLHRGFTTVRDCGGAHSALKDAINDGVFPGPRLLIAGHALSQSGGHADYRGVHDHSMCCGGAHTGMGRVCNGTAQCMQAVREEIRCGSDFIKIMGSGGVSSPTDKIEHLQFTPKEIRAMVECAANAGTYVTAHAYTVQAIRHCIDNGCRGIEHGNFLDRETAEVMKERGCFLTPTLVTYEQMGSKKWEGYLDKEGQKKNSEVLEAGLRALKIASEVGVTVCYGSDLLGPLGTAQTEEFRIRRKVLGDWEVLRSATVNAARLVMREGSLGQVKEGFEADLLLLKGNPLEDVTILDQPEEFVLAVMKEGRMEKSRCEMVVEDAHAPVKIKASL